ncbi:DUF3857 domain-containing protein [Lacinutrix sp. Hel_I_90]|uniref:DUF3857 domain-containing protein n=1 Tax=Lacinutrix sp. Hel_I_90 TaxID=1249999 RepID=UPI0005CA5A62|nr:DUF3857 domain-containing protein [Lacinutrix sp. Hel_I_90]
MKRYFALITLFLTYISFSQDTFNSETYTVTKGDLETTHFEKDSTANALVLYEYGESHIDGDRFDLIFKKKVKLKILNRNGFDKATISIFLYRSDSKRETVADIIATTYNTKNGETTQTKLTKDQIFEERYNDNYTIIKFTMPNVTVGSVITYSYKVVSPFIYKYKSWRFQDNIPKLYSEYKTSIPANYEYNIKLVGDLKLVVNESDIKEDCVDGGNGAYADCLLARYAIKDLPAFIEEDYMTTRDNYLSRIEYELKIVKGFDGSVNNITKTWKTTDKELKNDDNIGKKLKKGSLVKKLLSNEILRINNPLEKAKAIYTFVQSNYIWNEEFQIFKDISIKNLIKTKTGNVSEINFLLYNLLKENDIAVTPILISTRANGLPTKIYPVISDFNYILIQATIAGKTYQLDAVDPYLTFGQVPFRALNQYGRLLDFEDGSYWVDIKPTTKSSKAYLVELNLDNEGKISGHLDYQTNGYHSIEKKSSYFENPIEYKKKYEASHLDLKMISHEVTIESKNTNTFLEKINFEKETELVGNNLYINPFLVTFFDNNPLKLQERTYPIDFGYPDTYLYSYKLNFDPDVYEITEVPTSASYKLPGGTGTLILNATKNTDHAMVFLKFNFTEAIYNSNFYPYLKAYFNKIVEVQKNALIVLKKK